MTWTDDKQEPDDHDWLKKVHGHRHQPLASAHPDVACKLIINDAKINTIDCVELIPGPGVDSFTFPKGVRHPLTEIFTLRGGGRAGFKFLATATIHPFNYALVEFADDADNRWSLTSRLDLRPLEAPPVSATDAEKGELASGREAE